MLRRLTFVSLVALIHAPLNAAQPNPIDAIVSEEMQSQRIPGMAVAVIRKGEIVTAQGYGLANVEHNVPVTDRTIFQSGSLGKQFTATAVMLQVQDGRLSLTDPIAKFFDNAPAAWRDITVRHLLTHTSGIPDYNDGQLDYRKDYTEDELVKFARHAAARLHARRRVEVQQHRLHPARRDRAQGLRERSTATCCAIACSRRSA